MPPDDFDLMPSHAHFLCIDADVDGLLLLARTLARVFPLATISEARDYAAAESLVKTGTFDAIVAHRAVGADPVALIRGLRQAAPNTPILAVSTRDRAKDLLAAGATQFLPFDSWLLVGNATAAILGDKGSDAALAK
jgi:DNA-binding NarL/FixJ family response regulator